MQALSRHKTLLAVVASLLSAGPAWAAGVLAQVPEPGQYLSATRIAVVLVMLIPWLAFCAWVDSDCQFLRKKLNRDMWNPIVLGGGLLGLAIWLLMPWRSTGLFVAGFGLWFLITIGTCAVYVVVRNGKVDRGARVFTTRHIKSKLSGLGKKKDGEKLDAVERIQLSDHEGKKVPPPSDPDQMDAFDAAQQLMFDAFWRRATEVKLLVSGNGMGLSYTIDGVPTSRNDLLTREAAVGAMNYIKRIAGLDVNEHRRPQYGEISGKIVGTTKGTTDVDVQSSGTTKGELLRLRIVAQETRLRVADLGMTQQQQEKIESIVSAGQGLVLVSGPKTSGITTTLYALLRSHDSFMYNLLTIEKVPLMDLENVTQHVYEDGEHKPSYARQLQTVLRREPDVVMVSDCEDRETAHLAAKAATEGKKIYMGVQAKDSFDALKKLLSLAGDMEIVAKSLQAITSQRLIRKLCIACRQAYRPDPQLLKKANLPVDKIEHFFRPPPEGAVDEKGRPILCPNCQGSGYYTRTAVFEVLVIDDAMRELIRNGQPVTAIQAQARKTGMMYLDDVGLRKVIDGTTSMAEVLRALRNEEKPGMRAKR